MGCGAGVAVAGKAERGRATFGLDVRPSAGSASALSRRLDMGGSADWGRWEDTGS